MTDYSHRYGDPRIFVFGSNLRGIHGAGAARYARLQLGALQGVGEGLMNGAYALPTCVLPGRPLTLVVVARHVERFLDFARAHQELRFFVSPVGCGLAGYQEHQIAPMFAGAPENCDLPPGW